MADKKNKTEKTAPANKSVANPGAVISMTGAKANTPRTSVAKKAEPRASRKR